MSQVVDEIELTESQQSFLASLRELEGGDHWLCFVNAGFTMEDAKRLHELRLIDARSQLGMPTARLRSNVDPLILQADDAFITFCDKFDHESNEWLDMGTDKFFRAGFMAAFALGETKP